LPECRGRTFGSVRSNARAPPPFLVRCRRTTVCGRFYLTGDPGAIGRRFGAPPGQGGGRRARQSALPDATGAALVGGGSVAVAEAIPAAVALEDFSPLLDGDGVQRYNIAPTQTIVVVTDDGGLQQVEAVWGLIPSWAKDPSVGSKMINARAETLAEK